METKKQKRIKAVQRRQARRRKQGQTQKSGTAIVRVAAPRERPWELDSEQVTILKNSIAKGASDEELKYCLTVARRYRLDPFKQQIWFIKRWDKNADDGRGGRGAYIWTPQVGIYGLLHIAARDHKDFGSISVPEYGPMITLDVENHKIKGPEWARVKFWKKGVKEPTIGEAFFEEYCPKKYENTLFWRAMSRRMLSKCAKAQGAREAYPDLGGLYIPEESERMKEEFAQEVEEPFVPGLVERNEPIQQKAEAPLGTRTLPQGHISVIWQDKDVARITGDDTKLIEDKLVNTLMAIKLAGKQEFILQAIYIPLVFELCARPEVNIQITETQMKPSEHKPKPASENCVEEKGTIQNVKKSDGKTTPNVQILFNGAWLYCYSKTLWPELFTGIKKEARILVLRKEGRAPTVEGLIQVGSIYFESDGKTRCAA